MHFTNWLPQSANIPHAFIVVTQCDTVNTLRDPEVVGRCDFTTCLSVARSRPQTHPWLCYIYKYVVQSVRLSLILGNFVQVVCSSVGMH